MGSAVGNAFVDKREANIGHLLSKSTIYKVRYLIKNSQPEDNTILSLRSYRKPNSLLSSDLQLLAETMASAYLPNFASATLQVVLDRLTNVALQEVSLMLNAKDGMKRLERTLLHVQGMLNSVEDKEKSQRAWQIWLRDLKDAAYEADDLLDEISILASRKRPDEGFHMDNNQVRPSSSSSSAPFRPTLGHKMDGIQKKIDDIAREMEYLYMGKLVGNSQVKVKERVGTSSLTSELNVFGRENEKNMIKDLLLSDDSGLEDICVVSVIGMAGIGKTTVAQIVYNNAEVCANFELRMWVSVQQDFDVRKLVKSIIESATNKVIDLMDLDPLQVTLKGLLDNRRFLLVLDDVWSENYSDWDVLQAPLRAGANGSRVLVTTRSKTVAKIMNTSHFISLPVLSDEDCWLLFKRRAFGNMNSDKYPNLVAIGREIVRKCKGLPLAVKTLGSLLNSTTDEDEWNDVLESEIWDFPEEESDILPALRLSYQYLPAHLKQCFVYCAVFPRGYKFDKEKLVLLWMAQGFVQPNGRKRMEDVGSDYFDNLLSRSFFQYEHSDPNGKLRYLMHDLIHSLAQFVSNDEYFGMEDDGKSKKPHVPNNVRHLSILSGNDPKRMFEALSESSSLRTVLLLSEKRQCIAEIPFNVVAKLKCVRVLDLSNTHITELPSTIGILKHLRYFDLSETRKLKTMHKNICTLYSLQTLILRGCTALLELPKGICNLINIRHLELEKTLRMNSMPEGIGRLTGLQTLSEFVVGVEDGCKIGELKDMRALRGSLCISKLENVVNAQEAREAALNDKQYLHKLELKWSEVQDDNVDQGILAGLRPHKNIKELKINFYGGAMFPAWTGDSAFTNLATISFQNCWNCVLLPPLGQLPALKSLHIANMQTLRYVDDSFYGAGPVKGFPSLETLEFDNMASFVKWDIEEGDMPCLHQLKISSCEKLIALPRIRNLLSLQHLELNHCYELRELRQEALPTSLRSLSVNSCPTLRNWFYETGRTSLQEIAHNQEVTIDTIGIPSN